MRAGITVVFIVLVSFLASIAFAGHDICWEDHSVESVDLSLCWFGESDGHRKMGYKRMRDDGKRECYHQDPNDDGNDDFSPKFQWLKANLTGIENIRYWKHKDELEVITLIPKCDSSPDDPEYFSGYSTDSDKDVSNRLCFTQKTEHGHLAVRFGHFDENGNCADDIGAVHYYDPSTKGLITAYWVIVAPGWAVERRKRSDGSYTNNPREKVKVGSDPAVCKKLALDNSHPVATHDPEYCKTGYSVDESDRGDKIHPNTAYKNLAQPR